MRLKYRYRYILHLETKAFGNNGDYYIVRESLRLSSKRQLRRWEERIRRSDIIRVVGFSMIRQAIDSAK